MSYSLKLFGALAVVISLSSVGFLKADILKRRVLALNFTISAIGALSEFISYGSDERSVLLSKCLGDRVAYNSSGVAECNDADLDVSDKQIINEMLTKLGSGDVDGENRRIELCKTRLQTQLTAARRDYNDKSKVYRSIGVCAGLAFAIFII
ncbi:MAG: stage III sporulation protein AB [Acutalibacteraceae bacterium]|nr:stage III sporulation protein AB [Clostridia bacterium]MEE0808713.1 stage III sporulation protein AB [Acutalibacteraceae bacterium]